MKIARVSFLYFWIFFLFLIMHKPVKSQIIDCNILVTNTETVNWGDKPFSGACRTYDNDSNLIISQYLDGKLDGDSAYSRFYKNGLCLSFANYDNGNLIDYKEFEYYGIFPTVGGLNGGYVDRSWMVNQDSVKVGLIKLNKHLIENTPVEFIVDRADFDISDYQIINFSLTGGCVGGLLIEYTSKSNKITDSMKASFKSTSHNDFYFFDINCKINNDTIKFNDIHFKFK